MRSARGFEQSTATTLRIRTFPVAHHGGDLLALAVNRQKRVLQNVIADVDAKLLSNIARRAEVNPAKYACVLHLLECGREAGEAASRPQDIRGHGYWSVVAEVRGQNSSRGTAHA